MDMKGADHITLRQEAVEVLHELGAQVVQLLLLLDICMS
jgi:hypothetical protein